MSDYVSKTQCGQLVALHRNKTVASDNIVLQSLLSYTLFEKCVINNEKINKIDAYITEMIKQGMSEYLSMGKLMSIEHYQRFAEISGVTYFNKKTTNDQIDGPVVEKSETSSTPDVILIKGKTFYIFLYIVLILLY